jgi:hypothetical protein
MAQSDGCSLDSGANRHESTIKCLVYGLILPIGATRTVVRTHRTRLTSSNEGAARIVRVIAVIACVKISPLSGASTWGLSASASASPVCVRLGVPGIDF